MKSKIGLALFVLFVVLYGWLFYLLATWTGLTGAG